MSHPGTIVAAVVLTAGAITINALTMGLAVILLNVGLVVALVAWLSTAAGEREPHRLVGPLYLASVVIQTLHFIEEFKGRLYETLPPLFDLDPLQPQRFVIFNLFWIAIFLVAAVGVFRGVRLSLLVVWFMALLGGIGNALFHSWLAVRAGGYTPGLGTALINLPLGVSLVVLLTGPTTRRRR